MLLLGRGGDPGGKAPAAATAPARATETPGNENGGGVILGSCVGRYIINMFYGRGQNTDTETTGKSELTQERTGGIIDAGNTEKSIDNITPP